MPDAARSQPCLYPGRRRALPGNRAHPQAAYKYTAKGNLVAVVTNGTAVLGLGNIGALAGKPVMEGKGVLFKRFADIDVFDIELDTHDADEIIRTCQMLEPTFGGINLEDIKAPECFYIEETLKKTMKIPGLSRRSARHRHHFGRSPAECSRTDWQEDRGRQGCVQRRRRHRQSPVPSTTFAWACSAKTSSCATPRA